MKLTKDLHLVMHLADEMGEVVVHHTPIRSDVFRRYHQVIGKTYAKIAELAGASFAQYMMLTAPVTAHLTLEDVARDMGVWDIEDGVKAGLIAEIERLTNVWANGELFDLGMATKRGILDEEDYQTIMGQVVFFTLSSRMLPPTQREDVLVESSGIHGTAITSLNCMEYLNSSQTSKQGATTAGSVASSVKSLTTLPESDSPNSLSGTEKQPLG